MAVKWIKKGCRSTYLCFAQNSHGKPMFVHHLHTWVTFTRKSITRKWMHVQLNKTFANIRQNTFHKIYVLQKKFLQLKKFFKQWNNFRSISSQAVQFLFIRNDEHAVIRNMLKSYLQVSLFLLKYIKQKYNNQHFIILWLFLKQNIPYFASKCQPFGFFFNNSQPLSVYDNLTKLMAMTKWHCCEYLKCSAKWRIS